MANGLDVVSRSTGLLEVLGLVVAFPLLSAAQVY